MTFTKCEEKLIETICVAKCEEKLIETFLWQKIKYFLFFDVGEDVKIKSYIAAYFNNKTSKAHHQK
jgi:hypothetical protein